jgi:transposase
VEGPKPGRLAWKRGSPINGTHQQLHQTPEQRELERLSRRNEKLGADLASHKLALEIQGEASDLLERLLAESDTPSGQQP